MNVACGECGDWHSRDDQNCPIVQDREKLAHLFARRDQEDAERRAEQRAEQGMEDAAGGWRD